MTRAPERASKPAPEPVPQSARDALRTGPAPLPPPFPEWRTTQWFNTPRGQPLRVADLRGRIVLLHTFQMLCPGCVLTALPQAQRVHQSFPRDRVAVVGLHTVFEHHAAMNAQSLAAFLQEYRIDHPVGIDAPSDDGSPLPQTMAALGLRGTPSTLLLDAQGRLRLEHFGAIEDLALGAALGQLMAEATQAGPAP